MCGGRDGQRGGGATLPPSALADFDCRSGGAGRLLRDDKTKSSNEEGLIAWRIEWVE